MKHPLPLFLTLCLVFTGGCTAQDTGPTATGPAQAALPAAAPTNPTNPTAAPGALPENPAQPDPDAWPRTIKSDGTTYTIYQPQLDTWDGVTLEARAAVSVQSDGSQEATYGIIFLHAGTTTDREDRLVHFENLKVTKTQFPSLPDPLAYLDRFQSFVPKDIKDIELDRLEASLAIAQAQAKPVALKNAAPAILFATKPTLLVPVDGAPVWAQVGSTGLERIVNTRSLLLRDAAGTLYLHLYDGFATAKNLAGPWTVAKSVPAAVDQAKSQLVAAKQVDLLAGQPDPTTQKTPTIAAHGLPDLRVTTTPTELVVTEGAPKWTPIPGTQLLFIENTPGHVFKNLADQQTYLLASGRWFKAPGESGPWTYVPGKSLPGDFAQIPDSSPQENVKASVPGTRQAQEALISDSIPTTTKMDRKTAKLTPIPAYDGGEAKLVAIAGTPLMYAANTSTPVIRVDEKTWYACENGVWFSATSPAGAWAIASSVPAIIYTIPASSPLHYVTYVRVYRADADYVWVGYTPGYYGTVISADGTVVYGTGYLYEPYVTSTVYVAYPSTYGYSTNLAWTPWSGWAFGFAVGYAWGAEWAYWACMPPAPYWGPYWGYCYGWGYNAAGGVTAWGPYGWAGTSGNIYSQRGPWSGVSRYQGGFDAWTGNRWASQYGRAYNSVTGTRAIGQRGAVGNVYTGNYAYGARGAAVNDRTGNAAWHSGGTAGNAYTGNEINHGQGGFYNRSTGEVTHTGHTTTDAGTIGHIGDDVYAGHDGNVYKRTDDGWQQMNQSRLGANGAGTRDLNASADRLGAGGAGTRQDFSRFDRSSLDREYNARSLGSQRASSYRSSRPAFHGGGGFRRR